MLWIRLLQLMIVVAATPMATAASLWGQDGFPAFCNRLDLVPPEKLAPHVGGYLQDIQGRAPVSLNKIRAANFGDMEPLLARAARLDWGVLEVFTQKEFANPDGCILFLDQQTLAEIHKKYNLHGVWQIEATLADATNRTMNMRYMIVGQGRLIIGYPQAATVEISDGDAVTGKYNYPPYLSARIENSPQAQGLFEIRTLKEPGAEFEPFVGPYGVEIRALQLDGRDILVKYTWGIDQKRRARNVPIALRDNVATAR